MIANITTILYILTVSDESINSGTLQKGTAISRIDEDDGFQIYKYCNYLNSPNDTDSDSNVNFEVVPFEEENMYLISGKFCIAEDGSINVNVITNVHIPLDKEDIPIMKPTLHLVGKTMNYAQLSETGYTLQIQVKPYLSKDQFTPFLINLTHPPNGRFKNALMKAKKNSTIHTTGIFFLAEKQLYCEILEFQFISAKVETDSTISVPWKSKINSNVEASSSSPKSPIGRRIDLIRQNLTTQTPSPTNPSTSTSKTKRKASAIKISNISKSLLSHDNQIEIHDSDQQKINDDEEVIEDNYENTEDNEENVEDEEEKDNTSTKVSTTTRRSKKRRSNKS